jgi:hypothetical protein
MNIENDYWVKGNIFWSGERTPSEQRKLRLQIEAMDDEDQAYWRKKMPWVFDPNPADVEYESWA